MDLKTERLKLPIKKQTDVYDIDDFHNAAMYILDNWANGLDLDLDGIKKLIRDSKKQIEIEKFTLQPNSFVKQQDGMFRARIAYTNKHTSDINLMNAKVDFNRASYKNCVDAGVQSYIDILLVDAESKRVDICVYAEEAPKVALSGEFVMLTEVI